MAACGGGQRSPLRARAYAHEASALCAPQQPGGGPDRGAGAAGRRRRVDAAARAIDRIVAVERRRHRRRCAICARPSGSPPRCNVDRAARPGCRRARAHGATRLHAGHGAEALDFGAKAVTLIDRAREVVAPLRVTSCHGPVLPDRLTHTLAHAPTGYDRLSAFDESFLHLERRETPMHVGAVAVLDGRRSSTPTAASASTTCARWSSRACSSSPGSASG